MPILTIVFPTFVANNMQRPIHQLKPSATKFLLDGHFSTLTPETKLEEGSFALDEKTKLEEGSFALDEETKVEKGSFALDEETKVEERSFEEKLEEFDDRWGWLGIRQFKKLR